MHIFNSFCGLLEDEIFWELDKKKYAKKVKTSPASLEKLTLSWLKPSKLAPLSLKQDDFLRQLHLFFDSPDEVSPYLNS